MISATKDAIARLVARESPFSGMSLNAPSPGKNECSNRAPAISSRPTPVGCANRQLLGPRRRHRPSKHAWWGDNSLTGGNASLTGQALSEFDSANELAAKSAATSTSAGGALNLRLRGCAISYNWRDEKKNRRENVYAMGKYSEAKCKYKSDNKILVIFNSIFPLAGGCDGESSIPRSPWSYW